MRHPPPVDRIPFQHTDRSRPVFEDEDEEPTADGKQFDAVGKYDGPEEPDAGDLGPPVPEAPDLTAAAADADPRLQNLFWGLVVLFNVAILAVAVGVMLIAFGVDATLGFQVLLGGLILSVYGVYRYRDARDQAADIVGGDEDND